MKYRKLRIAWSVGCAIACVLLIVLWVRGYWWNDLLIIETKSGLTQIQSTHGRLCYIVTTPKPFHHSRPWIFAPQRLRNRSAEEWSKFEDNHPWGLLRNSPQHVVPTDIFTIPTWSGVLLVTLLTAIAAHPWIRWRFSLRTLLIATTLIAVVL